MKGHDWTSSYTSLQINWPLTDQLWARPTPVLPLKSIYLLPFSPHPNSLFLISSSQWLGRAFKNEIIFCFKTKKHVTKKLSGINLSVYLLVCMWIRFLVVYTKPTSCEFGGSNLTSPYLHLSSCKRNHNSNVIWAVVRIKGSAPCKTWQTLWHIVS